MEKLERVHEVYSSLNLLFQVKDPDAEGKTVHDTWSAMNGGINVRIWAV